jgi:hypothetical protein
MVGRLGGWGWVVGCASFNGDVCVFEWNVTSTQLNYPTLASNAYVNIASLDWSVCFDRCFLGDDYE